MGAKNWKTTLTGIIGGLLLALGPMLGGRLSGDRNQPPITIGNVLTGIAVAAMGINSKDRDVTGGTRQQDNIK